MSIIIQRFTDSIPVTIVLDSLGDGSSVASSAIDNSVNAYISANIQFKIKTGTGTSAVGTVTVYILRSADGGTTYDDLNSNSEILGVFNANVDATTYVFSVDTNIVGSLPDFWKAALANNSGATLDSTGGSFNVEMVGKSLTIQ